MPRLLFLLHACCALTLAVNIGSIHFFGRCAKPSDIGKIWEFLKHVEMCNMHFLGSADVLQSMINEQMVRKRKIRINKPNTMSYTFAKKDLHYTAISFFYFWPDAWVFMNICFYIVQKFGRVCMWGNVLITTLML